MYSKVGKSCDADTRACFLSSCRKPWLYIVVFICIFLGCAVAMLMPEASNTVVYHDGGAVIDASHADQGYIMIARPSNKPQKLRITLGKANLTYDLNSDGIMEVFPLQLGSGNYKVEIFEQVSGKKFSPGAAVNIPVEITDPNTVYLYPNQYVWYNENSPAVAKSMEICANATTDAAKVEAVYRYILENMVYDYNFAAEVTSGKNKGYLPSVDRTIATNTGVCFDFSALMACMLRSQGIATQMGIGYADKTYHAWNYILIDGTWYQYDITTVICQGTVKKYTPERVY